MDAHSMAERAECYLAHRRALGYKLHAIGYAVRAFARVADQTAPGQPLSISLALQWASRRPALPVTVASRLSVVRGFARYCHALDSRTQVPDVRLVHGVGRRRAPHIYTRAQVRRLLQATGRLEPWRSNLRPATYHALIGLLYCTGLRTCEALRLRDDDFDWKHSVFHVPATKYSPVRFLQLHPSAARALQRYQARRRKRFPLSRSFFTGPWGRPLSASAAQWTFRRLAEGIASNGARPAVRLYDFRHTFATTLIARWSRQRSPLARHLVLLSRYLGHKYFHHTFWYVQRDPAALQAAAKRFARFHGQTNPP